MGEEEKLKQLAELKRRNAEAAKNPPPKKAPADPKPAEPEEVKVDPN